MLKINIQRYYIKHKLISHEFLVLYIIYRTSVGIAQMDIIRFRMQRLGMLHTLCMLIYEIHGGKRVRINTLLKRQLYSVAPHF